MAGSLILHLTFSFAPPQRDKATLCLACRVTLSTAQCVVTQMITKTSPGHARLDTLEPPVQALQMTTPTTHYGVSPHPTQSLPMPTPNLIDWLLSPQIFRCFHLYFCSLVHLLSGWTEWDGTLADIVMSCICFCFSFRCCCAFLYVGLVDMKQAAVALIKDLSEERPLLF